MERLPNKSGFTLIELMMVVVILGVLATIAIPNTIKAQQRAKISRVLNDMRVVSVALETYHLEYGSYVPTDLHAAHSGLAAVRTAPLLSPASPSLTSPISFITTMPYDPFDNNAKPFPYIDYNNFDPNDDVYYCVGRYDYNAGPQGYIMASNGPRGLASPGIVVGTVGSSKALEPGDEIRISEVTQDLYFDDSASDFTGTAHYFMYEPGVQYVYDPTNGSHSAGGLFRVGP